MYVRSSPEQSCSCLKVFVGKGVVAETESTPRVLSLVGDALSVPARQTGHQPTAFVALGGERGCCLLECRKREGVGSAGILRNCWRIVISVALMQET